MFANLKPKNMFTPLEAESLILDLVEPIKNTETINLEASFHKVLAEDIASRLDFPYWDNSAMDGYAVRYEDVKHTPITLEIVEEIPAGKPPKKPLEKGQAARIFTGAMLPQGADTIVMQENTQRQKSQVIVLTSPPKKGDFVRYKGEFYQAGKSLLTAGMTLKAPEIAILATTQCQKISVFRTPKVAIFSTGDELISPDKTLKIGQIIDSNQYALSAFVKSQGAIPLSLGIIPDQPEILRETILTAIQSADFVLSTGGVSVGEYDYIEQILRDLGATIPISAVAIKPGKPLTVAKFANGCVYFGIPGNPVSALVTCWRFVQPALKKLSGLKENWQVDFIEAKTLNILKGAQQRETYLWGRVIFTSDGVQFTLAGGNHSSGNLINLAATNALAVVPPGKGEISPGEKVKVMLV
jgi:molybdopterin molybdotransferase